MTRSILTVGHSDHSPARFIELLKQNEVDLLVDVRSSPYSRWVPHFNKETLALTLQPEAILYEFLGRELGARSEDPNCFEDGRVSYERLASTEVFMAGITEVERRAERHRLALMCAEAEPLECHRTILVARKLFDRGTSILHLLRDGSMETHQEAMSRLKNILRLPDHDLFLSEQELLDKAYALQGAKIAFKRDFEIA